MEFAYECCNFRTGLDTLGLFRPFRLAESPVEIRRLALLFLDFVDHRGSQITYDQLANSLYGGNTAAEAKMKQFQRELNYAEIHDVVAVLKWVSCQLTCTFVDRFKI